MNINLRTIAISIHGLHVGITTHENNLTLLYIKNFEFIKKVGITVIKSKETSTQLEIAISHQSSLATVSSNTCSQTHVQIKYSLAYPYFGWYKIILANTSAKVEI